MTYETRNTNIFMKTVKMTAVSLLMSVACCVTHAQEVAVKTNLIDDVGLLTPNLGVEVGLAPRWTLNASGSFNAWKSYGHKWKHWVVQPEARYWFCDRFSGHFVGAHLLGGQYNVGDVDLNFSFLGTHFSKLKDSRYQGWFVGAGVAYGYDWVLSEHWNLEAEIGIGWTYTRFDRYPCAKCGTKMASNKPHNYVGPTKVALNIVYVF